MTATALLRRLHALGIAVQADNGALRLRPASAIPPDLHPALRAHKAELLALLAPAPQVHATVAGIPATPTAPEPELYQYPGGPPPGPDASFATIAAWIEAQAIAALEDFPCDDAASDTPPTD